MNNLIQIPDRLLKKINIETNWGAGTISLITNISNYFSLSPKFFPDYTIHGITHINCVLKLTDELISDDTLKKLTSRDIAVLIAATCIHDIGMFVTEDGLFKLIYTENLNDRIQLIDNLSWAQEWDTYLKKISRYTDQQLIDTFGDSSPICAPSSDINTMLRKDYLIYGEFLRRQHHRLAHHIALKDFPGTTKRDIFENCGNLSEQRDIIGLIARSHGISIRDTENYIRANYGDETKPNGIPIFYLMAVLRLADYLDAGKHRAPFELEDRQEISTSISKKEWKWNQCINIENYSFRDTKDKLIVQAKPETTLDFIKIENWLKQVQHEFDMSWAILAEKYDAGNFNLTIHRVGSNLLNEEARKIMGKSFLTREAKLTANPNLLKLLIRPLYGEDPSFGVREMIQNSVDACIERQFLEKKRGNLEYAPKIIVAIDTKRKTFKITDNGIGMNEEVLIDYYLSAGSSYRESDDWIKDYTINKKSQIARSGKFGVGVLSSFLLGESIHVQTRWIDDEIGYDFVFTMEQNGINVIRNNFEIGTSIEITLSDKTIQALFSTHNYNAKYWTEWFAFRSPLIQYYIDGKEVSKYRTYVPQENEVVKGWINYNSAKFDSFIWQYSTNATFYCNGIAIPSSEKSYIGQDYGWSMAIPSLSLIDKTGNLSLNLSRSTILEFPDESNFIREAYKYYIAKLLISNKSAHDYTFHGFSRQFLYKNENYVYSNYGFPASYLLTEKGFSILGEPFFVSLKNVERIILINFNDDTKINELKNLQVKAPVVFLQTNTGRASIQAYRNIVDSYNLLFSLREINYSTKVNLSRFWGERESFEKVKDKIQKGFYKMTEEQNTEAFFCRYDKKDLKSSVPFKEEQLDPKIYSIIAEYEIKIDNLLKNNVMLDVIEEYLGDDIWIPYKFEDRKKKFPKAFDELKNYMDD